jgi:hypothetical protein
MTENWMAILGLLFFACFIWWITTGKGFWARLGRGGLPITPGVKAILWIGYAATAIFVLATVSCEGPDELGRHQERQSSQHAQETSAG